MANHLSILNPQPQKIDGPTLLHHLVSDEDQDSPPAIEYLSPLGTIEPFTYGQLHQRANALARLLRSNWDSAADSNQLPFIVPLFIPQCPDLYIAELAALKAGAAFCPLSLDVPEQRFRFILQDVGAKIVLTTSQLRGNLPKIEGISIIMVDEIPSEIVDGQLSININPAQPAYIMYTSGSTGQPKGVVLSHSAATQALLAHERHLPNFSRFLQFANPTFDVSVFEIFFPLFRRATLICGDRRQLLNDLVGFMNRMDIDAAELTPSVASTLLQGRKSIPKLKLLLTIGEMLKRDVTEDFGASHNENGILYGMYGPTEATIHCTLQTEFCKHMAVGNIGVPLDTVSAFVVRPRVSDNPSQESTDILPIGEEGELAVGGHQLADGYLNRMEQTEAAFVHHPKYGRLYRTGDRARLTTFGKLECSGRISSGQVKLRGQRIELGEIEYAASKTPNCRTVVADIVHQILVVFCVCDVEATKESDVRETCQQWLPAYMVPTDVVLLSDLPYLSSGKVDRKVLRELCNRDQTSLATNKAMTPRRKALLDAVRDVLQVPVEQHTQLAAAGLDSLSSIRLASQLKQVGLPQPDATFLLEARTVEDIERELNRLEEKPDPLEEGLGTPVRFDLKDLVFKHSYVSNALDDIDNVFTTTAVQSAMLSETARDGHAYCNWIELSVHGQSLDKIHHCLQQLATQHDLIRSGFLAVPELQGLHAVIVWTSLQSTQIRNVDELDYNFVITEDTALLRPVQFQIKTSGDESQILLQIHHALYDQWSFDILRSDLSCLLQGLECPSSRSFELVSQFHSARYDDSRSERSLEFWQDHLRDFVPTPLPSMTGRKLPWKLARTSRRNLIPDLSSLRSKSRTLGISAPALFQAAISYILSCYTGTTDVGYGVVFSGRHLPISGLETIFGPCLCTLPLRIDCSTTRTCLDLLKLVQECNRAMQGHALTPPADIKSCCESASQTRLVDILFVWQETSLQKNDEFVQEVDSADHHEFNLVLEFEPSTCGVQARATYQEAMIPFQQVDILLQQIQSLVEQILQKPDGLVEDLAGSLPYDLLSTANSSPSFGAARTSLTKSFEKYAEQNPNSPALIFATSTGHPESRIEALTYRDLNDRTNKTANFLTSLGVLSNDLISLSMDKCVDFYVLALAAIKIGAGYVPITPETPSSRVGSILSQARVKLCLCDRLTAPNLQDLQMAKVIDISQVEVDQFDASSPKTISSTSHVAYTVFTSGSTGEPKGVAITMQNLLGNLQALAELYQVRPGDRILQACSQAFDVSVFEIFFAFYTGICLCSAPNDVLFRDLEGSIRALSISHLSLTPTVAALVDPDKVPNVRFLVTAGEGVTDFVHSRWADKGLHQGYGPSETTNVCTVNMNMAKDEALGNIGPPLQNTSAFVVSTTSNFDILPAGSVGEFAFGGEQVFSGYIGLDQLNAEKIVTHPEFGRLYKSGDMGRVLHDGSLLITGRMDDQVKLRGNRIEMGDVNASLLRAPSVHDCTAMVIGEQTWEQSLVAFIVPQTSQRDSTEETHQFEISDPNMNNIYDHLEGSLPPYMVPSLVIPISRLPLTSLGKLDRRLLRRLVDEMDTETRNSLMQQSNEEITEDWSADERQIATALAEVLRIPAGRVTRNSSFFALGLNSLSAIAFSKLATSLLHTHVNVSTILRSPSVFRLVRALSAQNAKVKLNEQPELPELLPFEVTNEVQKGCASSEANIESILPCTPLQEAMLSTDPSKTLSSYCNSLTLRISGSVQTMKHCWERMLARHTILRTRFVSTRFPKHPHVQVVLKDVALPWNDLALEDCNDKGLVDNHIADRQSETVSEIRPFYIDAYPSTAGTLLTLHMHHAIYDGISMSRLLQDVELEYYGKELSPVVPFEPMLAEVQAHGGERSMSFWSTQLQGFIPKPFPAPRPRQRSEESLLDRQPELSSDIIDDYCRRHAVSQLAVFQTALSKTLACCQKARDICFGNVVSGRTVSVDGVENLVAPCFNTVPVRVDLNPVGSNLQTTRRLSEDNFDALSHQLAPLRRIQALSASPSKHLFDTLLVLQPASPSLDDRIWKVEREIGSMDMPLVFEVQARNGSYKLLLHFLRPNFSRMLAEMIFKAFSCALESCLRYPHSDIKHFHDFDSAQIAGILATPEDKIVDSDDIGQSNEQWSMEEGTVREVYSRLAGVHKKHISKDTPMYRIGLDSLNAAQIANQLRSFGIRVDAADVIEALTPLALGALARKNASTKPVRDRGIDLYAFDRLHRGSILRLLQLQDKELEAVRPCTSVQSGMLAQSLQSSGKLYVNHVTYRIPEWISSTEVQRAWRMLREKHEVLRMGFHQLEDPKTPFVMVILDSQVATVPFIEGCGDYGPRYVEEQAQSFIMESIHRQGWQVTIHSRGKERNMTVSLHHALYDAETMQILLEDLATALSSSNLGSQPGIDPLLHSLLAAEVDHDGSTAIFWRKILQDANMSKFPDLTPTLVVHSELRSQIRWCTTSLSTAEGFCRTESATLQALGQTAWAMLLTAYTGETDVVFGTILSGQSMPGTKGVAFPSFATIPVVTNTNLPSLEILRNMVNYNSSVQKHRFAPLSNIQQFAKHGGRPLFDSVFVYQKTLSRHDRFDWPLVRETSSVDYTASLELEQSSTGELLIRLTFDTRTVPPQQASLILQQYDSLLSQLVSSGEEQPSSGTIYSISPQAEPSLPTDVFNLHSLFEQSACRHPHRKALEFVYGIQDSEITTRTWTYHQLDDRGNQVAHLIQQFGALPESVIAVCMNKCPQASFAFVGILKAGCSFLAIDPELPEVRLRFILEDSKARLLLVDKDNLGKSILEATQCVELSESMLESFPPWPIAMDPISPDATSYCLYTSGTTGTPKGCEISHENAVQAMLAFQRLFAGHWTEASRWLQFASYWFDVSVLEHFWSWSVGITVVGAARDLVLEDLPGFLRRLNITHIDLTPSLARLVHPQDVPSLWNGVFITGGEALKQEIIDAWGPKATICNGYGPTEATIGVTMNTFIGADAKPSNIGHQFDNVGAYVLRPGSEEPVLRGAIGELCVSGKLVGKGYLNRPDLTSRLFPFLHRFDERVYRTGDLVRLLADGSFAFIGRQDLQVKLRGQRLEIGEIDNATQQAKEEIDDVVSLVIKTDGDKKEMLVSFFTVYFRAGAHEIQFDDSESSRRLVQTAKEACRSRLPGYMVPTYILPISGLPLTVNNKIDSKRLSALFNSAPRRYLQALDELSSNVRPMDQNERCICNVLISLLDISDEDVSSNSNLFSLGLSSLSAMQFSRLLKRAGFNNASVSVIMQNHTLDQLGHALSSGVKERQEHNFVEQSQLWITAFAQRYLLTAARNLSLSTDQIETVAPCTPLQQGLIIDSMRMESRPYFNDFRYIVDNIDILRLQLALQKLVDDSQLLRTHFFDTDEGFSQAVLHKARVSISTWSVRSSNVEEFLAERKQDWLERNDSELVSPFEVHVVRSPANAFLVIHIHHALYDGISYKLMIRQLSEIYRSNSVSSSGPSFTSALPFGALCPHKDGKLFWKTRLAACQYIALPEMEPQHCLDDPTVRMSIKDSSSIEAKRRSIGVSHQALFQTCFEIVLHQHAPSVQMYGMVVSGRSIELDGADRILGPLFNTLAQPLEITDNLTFSAHVQRCHRLNTEALPFQHTSLRHIRKWSGQRQIDPMFDALFVFQHDVTSDNESARELFQEVEKAPRAEYPLACEVDLASDGSLTVTFLAQSAFFNKTKLEALLENFKKALDCIINRKDDTVGANFHVDSRLAVPRTKAQANTLKVASFNGMQKFEWTEQARSIRHAVCQLSGSEADEVGEHTSIFSLGLDSIDAVRLTSRLKKHGMSIPVSKILRAQTIARMTKAVRDEHSHTEILQQQTNLEVMEQQLSHAETFATLRQSQDVERVLPATPHQEALVADMVRSELYEYFNHDVLHLQKNIDLDRLRNAWHSVVQATPVLRTSFAEITEPGINVVFAQVVHRKGRIQFGEHKLDGITDMSNILDDIRKHVIGTVHTLPPWRLTLVTVQSDLFLVLSLAHALYDGHSIALLHEDVQRAYYGTYEPRPSNDRVIEAALNATEQSARDFWAGTLSAAKTAKFPRLSSVDGDVETHRAERLSTIHAPQAQSFCKKHGITMQALSQTCWALTLAHYTQHLEVLFGVVLACRDSEEAEQIMFPTMNTVVMRSSLHGSRIQMLQYMQDMITNVLPYQRTPLRTIKAACANSVQRSGSDMIAELFDTLFIYQRKPQGSGLNEEPLYESVSGSSSVDYPVAVEMEQIEDQLVIRAACKSSVLDESGTTELLDKVDMVLHAITNSPEKPTVEFQSDLVSVCGLEQFPIRHFNDRINTHKTRDLIDESSAESSASTLVPTIIETLAQVSEIPATSITPKSTIESVGIDSISAIKVAALLRKQSIKISVSEITKAKTPVRMAEAAENEKKKKLPFDSEQSSRDVLASIVQQFDRRLIAEAAGTDVDNIETLMPATSGQEYMLSMWKKTRGQLFYPTFEYDLETHLNPNQIGQTWAVLVDRHPILRTVFCSTSNDGVPLLQVVLQAAPDSFSQDSEGLALDSSKQPMVLLQASKNDIGYRLKLTIHHALYDAVSLPLLMQDFRALVARAQTSRSKVEQADFVALSISPKARNARKDFWTRYLRDVNPLQLSQPLVDGPQRRVEIFKPKLFTCVAELESLARKQNLSTQALLFASYAKVYTNLASRTNDHDDATESDVVLGIYLSNRSHLLDLDRLAAPTLSLVPLLVRTPQQSSLLDLAKQVQADLQEISTAENSAVTLAEVYEWAGVRVDTFVNLLKLPERGEEGEMESGVVLKALDDRRLVERREVVQAPDVVFELPSELEDFRGAEAYMHSVDVEMAITPGGLDVGLFCPEAMLGLEEAEKVSGELGSVLEKFVGKARK